jgi:hypothetical protein
VRNLKFPTDSPGCIASQSVEPQCISGQACRSRQIVRRFAQELGCPLASVFSFMGPPDSRESSIFRTFRMPCRSKIEHSALDFIVFVYHNVFAGRTNISHFIDQQKKKTDKCICFDIVLQIMVRPLPASSLPQQPVYGRSILVNSRFKALTLTLLVGGCEF